MNFHTKPSVYLALVVWGATGFMAQPSFASFVVHLFIVPVLLFLVIWLAHYEARKE